MKLNILLIIAGSILVFLTLSSSHEDDTSLIVKIGEMIHQYEHFLREKEQEKSLKMFFEGNPVSEIIMLDNAGMIVKGE